MKQILYVFLLLVLMLPLFANDLDNAVSYVMENGSIIIHEGDSVFMADIKGELFPTESEAYSFVSQVAFVFLAVRQDWDTLSNSTHASVINSADAIACPWETESSAFVISIPISEICNEFSYADFEELGERGIMDKISEYVDYYGDISPYSMY